MGNKSAKEKLIKLYGEECWIDKLHLRHDTERRYTSKGQRKRMKQLTYHHILEKSKGGKATIENGAVLSAENHIWFHQQPPAVQAEINKKFQEYKQCKVVVEDSVHMPIEVHYTVIDFKDKERRKEKRDFQRLRKEIEDR